ncbi:hypothetical protein [Shewanella baltica]|uniref:hypothetical protein n=1 Tax=Shewanella baltica TaxID=62322 RepID=UPI00217E0000|nr:hypothetical protein [Shewanella baltica]MCS6100106.1 hypothetical protein [Shewanella baltica]MCS6183041.1 hypothetical protein [Shewanella baltica]
MNVQIHPSYFRKIVLSEPFSLMIDVAAASGSKAHHVYVLLALARVTKLPTACVNAAVDDEINRRSIVHSARVSGGVV